MNISMKPLFSFFWGLPSAHPRNFFEGATPTHFLDAPGWMKRPNSNVSKPNSISEKGYIAAKITNIFISIKVKRYTKGKTKYPKIKYFKALYLLQETVCEFSKLYSRFGLVWDNSYIGLM